MASVSKYRPLTDTANWGSIAKGASKATKFDLPPTKGSYTAVLGFNHWRSGTNLDFQVRINGKDVFTGNNEGSSSFRMLQVMFNQGDVFDEGENELKIRCSGGNGKVGIRDVVLWWVPA